MATMNERAEAVEVVTEPAEQPAAQEANPEPVKRSASRKKSPPKDTGYRVYIGPSIRGRVQYGTVFSSADQARKELEKEFESFPTFGIFLVTGQQLPQARIDVKTPGTALYAQAQRLRSELTKSE